MSTIRMQVIPPNVLGARLPIEGMVAPVITGKGHKDYACGSCGSLLLQRVRTTQVRDLVLRCPRCGSLNEVPTPPAH